MSWLGRMVVRTASPERVELSRSRWLGLVAGAGAMVTVALALAAVPLSRTVAMALAAVAGALLLVATARRQLVVDLREGVVTIEERWLGVPLRRVVPLFHVRAVMVVPHGSGYTSYLQTRIGDAIELDHASSPARLLRLARVLADAADWKLIYQRAS